MSMYAKKNLSKHHSSWKTFPFCVFENPFIFLGNGQKCPLTVGLDMEKIALLPRVFDPPLPAIISGRSSVGSTRFSESFRFQNDSIYLFYKLGSNSVFP